MARRRPDRALWKHEWEVVVKFDSNRTGLPETLVLHRAMTADTAREIVDALRARGVERDAS
jgi:hypothetical protein